jgi:carboxymethylenebutenolidase
MMRLETGAWFPVLYGRQGLAILAAGLATAGGLSAQEAPSTRLSESPRHQEWATVKYGQRAVRAFVVYPQVKEKAAVVLIIHETRGLTNWLRSASDRVAELGYIAVAPDLLSGMGPNGGDTSSFPDEDAAINAIYKLAPEQVTQDLQAVADYATRLPAANGKLSVAGFCWGGSQAFQFATDRADLMAAFVFYGTAPTDPEAIKRIRCPVYGFYGEDDARVTSTVEATQRLMKTAGKTFEPVTYESAGHAFMRIGEQALSGDPNRKARDAAWQRWADLLKRT